MTNLARVTDLARATNAALMANVVGRHGGEAPPLPPIQNRLYRL